MQFDLNLNLGNGLRMRPLVKEDAALVAEATSREQAPSLWGPRPAGPYSLHDGQVALSAWDPAAGGQFSIGILDGPIHPDNEPSLRVAQRASYHFEQRLPRHCRDWSSEDAEHDSWHDCLIWAHVSDSPGPGQA